MDTGLMQQITGIYIESMPKAIKKRNWSEIGNPGFNGDTSGI